MKCILTTIAFAMPSARPREALASASAAYTVVSPGGGKDGPNKVGWSITQTSTAANA
jgi:hypothetical protein